MTGLPRAVLLLASAATVGLEVASFLAHGNAGRTLNSAALVILVAAGAFAFDRMRRERDQ